MLIAEDPTAGVDVGAKSEIYRLIAKALESGLTVIVVSTDFEEVAHICHRALVFSRGRIVAELAGKNSRPQLSSTPHRPRRPPDMQSIQSNALEPTRHELQQLSFGAKVLRLLPIYGLVILTVAADHSLLASCCRNTFPTLLNVRSIISDKAIIALLSLGAMIPMAAGRIDLTVGYGIVLWHILAISLQTAVRHSLAARRAHRALPWRASWAC